MNILGIHTRSAASLAVGLLAIAFAGSARAATINFDSSQGYSTTGGLNSTGSLDQQPGGSGVTSWLTYNSAAQSTGNAGAMKITSDGTNQVATLNNLAQSSPSGLTAPFFTYKLTENNNLTQPFSNTSSKIGFSFDLRLNGPPSATVVALFRPRFSSAPTSQTNTISGFEVDSDGAFKYQYETTAAGTGTLTTRNAAITSTGTGGGANRFIASDGVFFNVSGTADFSTGILTLSVNGVAQNTNTTMYFNSATANFTDFYMDLLPLLYGTNVNVNGDLPTVSIDNLFVVAPEPASGAMIGCGSLLLMRRRRRAVRVVA